ncbi:MAG: bifunctional DNA-formamidopyrimidine glycosylase/DNA-(apurinic or apyrimidinic site) lyase [Phycisphaeraceae bacterium]|nr:bifunctional DNA-formamidopyrimidine glycosylase/DNA-(apurinic or apyrimidinic site) lyase [Phycisphaeraceae bacterium]
MGSAMPELPEVETLRRSLETHLVGRVVVDAELRRRDILTLPGDPPGGWTRGRTRAREDPVDRAHLLVGARVWGVARRGKQLAIRGDSGVCLCVHLGMTGTLRIGDFSPDDRHVHACWRLDNTSVMYFRDPRRFGGLWTYPSPEALAERWHALGPDALAVGCDDLYARLKGSARAIKAALLDQGVIAGVGNIYADESLHAAGIHPRRMAGKLTHAECGRLADAIRSVLGHAITRGGSTFRDYVDAQGNPGTAQAYHMVYGRAGQACFGCRRPLQHAVIGQRQTVWCPACQPETPPH